jgi:Domain of unknown function (DUF4440)
MMSDLETLRRLNRAFIHNYVTNDVLSHHAILHPQFAYMASNGKRLSRADYLSNWAHGFDPEVITYWDMRGEDISIAGETAIVRAANAYVENGQSGMACYTDVYVRAGGRWLCLHAQISNVTPENAPSESTIVCRYIKGVELA